MTTKYMAGGGIRKSLPIYQRTTKRVYKPDYFGTGDFFYDMEVDGHYRGNFHRALPTGIPRVAWNVYHIRRCRVGQLCLFSSTRALSRGRKM